MVVPGTMFEELGFFNHIGPVDGHDVNESGLNAEEHERPKGPQFPHIMTKKGKGHEPAGERSYWLSRRT